jgi:hypothetical protein
MLKRSPVGFTRASNTEAALPARPPGRQTVTTRTADHRPSTIDHGERLRDRA